mgnify:CR=1 FL=1
MLRIDINLIFTVVNVLVLCLAVRIFLWKPVHKVLAERQANVDASLADAAKAKTEAEALVEEQKAFRANIEEEKSAALAEARKQAQAESSRIVADAHSRADIILREAENDAQSRKDEILRQAQGEITEIIVAATAKVAGVPVGGDSDLYDEFLKKAGGQHE